jgi:plasmid stabilization system protein ParE
MEDEEFTQKPSILTPECENMLEEALDYITVDSPKQAEIMQNQFSKIRRSLERMPGIGTKYKNGMRRIMLGKFRYFVYYREQETEIYIVGIQHTSRGTEFSEN